MMKQSYTVIIYLAAILIVGFAACQDGNDFGDGYTPSLKEQEVGTFVYHTSTYSTPLTFKADATDSPQTITVTSNEMWTAMSSDESWCTVSPANGGSNGTVTVTVKENLAISPRSATITIKGGNSGDKPTVSITQFGVAPHTTASTNPLSFKADATDSPQTIAVTSNEEWTATSSDESWCIVSPSTDSNEGVVTVTVTKNVSTLQRNATITIKGEQSKDETKIAVVQAEEYGKFVFLYGSTDGWSRVTGNEQKIANMSQDGLYTGFVYCADLNGTGVEFKFLKHAGDFDDDSQLNSSSLTTISGDFEKTGNNDNIKASKGEGVYYVELDLKAKTLMGTYIHTMGIIGDFNGWSNDVVMTWDANDYCFVAKNAGVNANGWKFRVNKDWAINLGSNDSDWTSMVLNDLVGGGQNIGVVGTTIKLYPTRRNSDYIYCTVASDSVDIKREEYGDDKKL